VAFNHSGSLVSIGTNSQNLLVCRSADLSLAARKEKVHGGSLFTCAWSPDDKYIATGSNDQTINITSFDSLMDETSSRSGPARLQPQLGTVRCLKFMPSGTSLLAGFSQDGIARIIDVATSEVPNRLECSEQGHVTSVDISGSLIVAGCSSGRACVFDQRLENPLVWDHQFKSKDCVVVSMYGSHVAAGTQSGTISLWDIRSSLPVWSRDNYHTDAIRSVGLSKNGRYLASASFDKTVRVCDTMATDEVRVLCGHRNRVVGLAWSETGQLVSSGCDSRVILWS
jgi:WD40 repeat protein